MTIVSRSRGVPGVGCQPRPTTKTRTPPLWRRPVFSASSRRPRPPVAEPRARGKTRRARVPPRRNCPPPPSPPSRSRACAPLVEPILSRFAHRPPHLHRQQPRHHRDRPTRRRRTPASLRQRRREERHHHRGGSPPRDETTPRRGDGTETTKTRRDERNRCSSSCSSSRRPRAHDAHTKRLLRV